MRLLCRGELWLCDASNENIIYCAAFIVNDKEKYNTLIDEAKKKNIIQLWRR